VLGALAFALVGVAGTALFVATNEEPLAPEPDIPLDVWVPYWTLDDALPDFDRRGGSLREVSPFWFTAVGVDQIAVDANASVEATDAFMEAARSADVAVVPSIVDLLPAGEMAAILADPVTRARHVQAIRRFAADGDFDGIDIDYEQFAFASTAISSTPTAVNQKGDTSRIEPPRRSKSGSASSSVQYGTQASSGMSGLGANGSSFVATNSAVPATPTTARTSAPSTSSRRLRSGSLPSVDVSVPSSAGAESSEIGESDTDE